MFCLCRQNKISRVKSTFWTLLLLAVTSWQMKAGSRVAGTIRDLSRAPVQGASVLLISLDRALQTETPADGHFDFGNVPGGVYQLQISHPGFVKQKLSVNVSANAPQPLEIVLQIGNTPDMDYCGPHTSITYELAAASGPRISGFIRDYFNHTPISKAEITLRQAGKKQRLSKVTSDLTGRFKLEAIPAGYYDLRVSRQDYWPDEEKKLLLPRENNAALDIQFLKRSQIVVCQ